MTASLKSGYRGSTHTDVNTACLVWHIANKARELGLQTVDTKQEANAKSHSVLNVLAVGYKKFEMSSLVMFNKKLADLKQEISCHTESDEIAPCQVLDDEEGDVLDASGELLALHDDD